MQLLVTPNGHTADQLQKLSNLKRKAVATANQVHKLYFHSSSRINHIRSSYCRNADHDLKAYVYQFSITMNNSPVPLYSLYYLYNIDNDITLLFVGTYGKIGAINFETVRGANRIVGIQAELKHADYINSYDVKFIFTYNFEALPTSVVS